MIFSKFLFNPHFPFYFIIDFKGMSVKRVTDYSTQKRKPNIEFI